LAVHDRTGLQMEAPSLRIAILNILPGTARPEINPACDAPYSHQAPNHRPPASIQVYKQTAGAGILRLPFCGAEPGENTDQ